MATYYEQSAVTLPVTNIDGATSFYLAALAPLGYQVISNVQHQTSYAASQAVGLGPGGGTRVDLFLSESNKTAKERHGGKTAHLVFPASSRAEVRGVYTAALNAGGKSAKPPGLDDEGIFSTCIVDVDANKLEVGYTTPASASFPRAHSEARQYANDDDDDDDDGDRLMRRRTAAVDNSRWQRRKSRDQDVPAATVAATGAATYPFRSSRSRAVSEESSRRGSVRSNSTHKSNKKSDSSGGGGGVTKNAVVGTLLGAAAGAAVAYVFKQTKDDSNRRDDTFRRRMEMRDQAKAEARAQTMARDWQSRTVSARSRGMPKSADSGYNSGNSPPGYNETASKEPYNRRTAYYYPEDSASQRRGSLSRRRSLEDDQASSQRTVRADDYGIVRRRTTRDRGSSARPASTAYTRTRPQPPSPPPGLGGSRRTSRVEVFPDAPTASGRVPSSQRSADFSRSAPVDSYVRRGMTSKSQNPRSQSRSISPDSHRSNDRGNRDAQRKSRPSSRIFEAPPSSYLAPMVASQAQMQSNAPLSASSASYHSTRSQSSAAPDRPSKSNNNTSRCTSRTSRQRDRDRDRDRDREQPRPEPAPASLTEKQLKALDLGLSSEEVEARGDELWAQADDDVATLVPDDSISCVPSPPPKVRRGGRGGPERRRVVVS